MVGGFGSIYEDTPEARQTRDNFLRLKLGTRSNKNHIGQCGAVEAVTESQKKLSDYFKGLRETESRTFIEKTEVTFQDIFRFRGILG